jgi:uracil-DNA glycosylase
MRSIQTMLCPDLLCADVQSDRFSAPGLRVDPNAVSVILVSEAVPASPDDDYGGGPTALFARTTVLAFQGAGAPVESISDILRLGVYLTSAVKCPKLGYGLKPATIDACSRLLEREIAPFKNARAMLLMGDVAIRAPNGIARRAGEPRVIPAISTYKLRDQTFLFRGMRVFPSYLQAGPSFFIERSKRRMIAEDIAAALRLTGWQPA